MTGRVLAVTGATGFVGQSLVDAALGEGWTVRALARRAQAPREGVEWIAGDLADHAALARLVAGADAVIHVAGVVNAADAAGFAAGNVAGTAAVLAAMQREGAKRLVFVSSLAAREPALSAYGGSKARAEALVAASGLDWTIVRPPAVHGPRDAEMFELFRAARWGLMPMPAGGRASLIHVADLARALLALVPAGEGVSGRTFEPDDGRPGGWPHGDLARAIGAAVGRRVVVLPLGAGVLRLAARIDTGLRGPRAKLTLDRAAYMAHPDWVSDPARRLPERLWAPAITGTAALQATADWYRAQGWL